MYFLSKLHGQTNFQIYDAEILALAQLNNLSEIDYLIVADKDSGYIKMTSSLKSLMLGPE